MMYFFDKIYYHLFNKGKKRNAVPEIPVLAFISFCQTDNILLIINLFFIVLKPNINYQIPTVFLFPLRSSYTAAEQQNIKT